MSGSFLSITVRTPGEGGTAPISPNSEAGRGDGSGVSSDPSDPNSWEILLSLLPFPGRSNFVLGYKVCLRSLEGFDIIVLPLLL